MEIAPVITLSLILATIPVYFLSYVDYVVRQISIKRVILFQLTLLLLSWMILIGANGRLTVGLSLYCALTLFLSAPVLVSQCHPSLSRNSTPLFRFWYTKAMLLLLWVGTFELFSLNLREPIALPVYVYALGTYIVSHYECMLYVMSKARFNRHISLYYKIDNHWYKPTF